MINVALITINFNGDKDTHTCLLSVSKLSKNNIRLSVIVVDNGSEKNFALREDEKKDNVICLRSEKNLGFTGGNNLGMQYALRNGADYILLLNNDTIVEKNLLNELVESINKNPLAGVAVPKIYFAKGHEYHKSKYKKEELGKVFWYAGGGIDWKNVYTFHRGVDEVDNGQYQKEENVDFATGCCMLIKRETLEKVGFFDDKFFLYFEDGDLSERIKKAGFSMRYVPTAIVWHINAGSSGSGSGLHDYYLTRNRMIFGMRYAPFKSKLALIKESMHLLISGREWQQKGIRDFYLGRLGKGSFAK